MIHTPAPTRVHKVAGHEPLYVYPCKCGAVFFVLEHALAHMEQAAVAA